MWFSSLIHLFLSLTHLISSCFVIFPPGKGQKEEEEELGLPNANLSPHPYIFLTLLLFITCMLSLSVYAALANLHFFPPSLALCINAFVAFIWLLTSPTLKPSLALLKVSRQLYIKLAPIEQIKCTGATVRDTLWLWLVLAYSSLGTIYNTNRQHTFKQRNKCYLEKATEIITVFVQHT